MRTLFFIIIFSFFFISLSLAADGVVTVKSSHDVKTTADRLEAALLSKGMTVFVRIDHAGGAESVGLELRPTELVIFGNPKVGTLLMQCQQSAAIDLPQKALIWQGEDGQVWFTYNNPQYMAGRHDLADCGEKAVKKVAGVLAKFSKAATAP